MTSVRAAKSKGSAFEADCTYSLQQKWPSCYRTHERGYVQGLDIIVPDVLVAECKRLKGMSWEQAKKFWNILVSRTPKGHYPYLIFQSNRQPPLVFHSPDDCTFVVQEFKDVFKVPFLKHPPAKMASKEGPIERVL